MNLSKNVWFRSKIGESQILIQIVLDNYIYRFGSLYLNLAEIEEDV